MNNASKWMVVETATRGLYQVVNTQTGMRTRPWKLGRSKRILAALLK
jgi:hypothetical protein